MDAKPSETKISPRKPLYRRNRTITSYEQWLVRHNRNAAKTCRLSKVPALLNALPFELQALIVRELTWHELLRVRLTSRLFHNLTEAHSSELTKTLIKRYKGLARVHSLYYDVIGQQWSDLGYVIALSHRCYLVENLARFLARYYITEYCRFHSNSRPHPETECEDASAMINNMKPHLLIISHMLEEYQTRVVAIVRDGDFAAKGSNGMDLKKIEATILRTYNDEWVHYTSMVFYLLKRTLRRLLRPMSYAGSLERYFRGWTGPRATDEQIMALMIFGGLDVIKGILVIPNYSERMKRFRECTQSVLYTTSTEPRRASRRMPNAFVHPPWRARPLSHSTVAKVLAIIPDFENFFNWWYLKKFLEPKEQASAQSEAPFRLAEFLWYLKREWANSDFELRRAG
ncbi:MAG: hypothetical protein Q9219_002827 [cf. Caloplaca sp. 3 TL-2023]